MAIKEHCSKIEFAPNGRVGVMKRVTDCIEWDGSWRGLTKWTQIVIVENFEGGFMTCRRFVCAAVSVGKQEL